MLVTHNHPWFTVCASGRQTIKAIGKAIGKATG